MATVVHCLFAFESLAAHLEDREATPLKRVRILWSEFLRSGANKHDEDEEADCDDQDDYNDTTESPLFVTWNADSDGHGYSLRGCIGTFEAQAIEEGVSSYAVTAAMHDTRFRPIARPELPSLEVAVTLLTDFEDAADVMDWTLGTHGLRLSFRDGGRRYGATYLPDVAPELGWSKEETLVNLMRKAGWQGHKEQWRDVELKVVRYQGRKKRLEYAEYKRWRDWADKQ